MYPQNYNVIFGSKNGAKRFAIREDGYVIPMYNGTMTYEEYCEQYKKSHIVKVKSMNKN